MRSIVVIISFLLPVMAWSQERIEVGIAGGTTHPHLGEAFEKAASAGNGQAYWLGYGLDKNWGVEIGLDNLDFDGANSKHQFVNLTGVYRFAVENFIHPVAKLGIATVTSKDFADVSTSSFGAKAALGLEADFKYVSFGALVNFYHALKTDDALDYKNTQMVMPAIFLSFHTEIDEEQSESEAPVAKAETAKKDADSDGVADEDDKCPGTSPNLKVNSIGCAEKETASVKLSVEFETGKSVLSSTYNSEIENLAGFMKKFTDTNVEIAGHTDNKGLEKLNVNLSQKRAEAVKAALVEKGVSASRITAKGYGSAKPISDNNTAEGRKLNRRVVAEISVSSDIKK